MESKKHNLKKYPVPKTLKLAENVQYLPQKINNWSEFALRPFK